MVAPVHRIACWCSPSRRRWMEEGLYALAYLADAAKWIVRVNPSNSNLSLWWYKSVKKSCRSPDWHLPATQRETRIQVNDLRSGSQHCPIPMWSHTFDKRSILCDTDWSISIYTKKYRKWKKRLCVRLRSRDKHHVRNFTDREAQISLVSGRKAFLICALRSADFLRWCLSPERNLMHNLFFYFL